MLASNFQHCWMLHFVSFGTSCCMLLRVVGSCCAKFETGQTFSYVQTDATTPIIIVGHQCCTCTLLNTCIALCNWTQHCWPTISQHCWMLHVASVCTSYCMLLRVFASCCAMFDTGQTFSYVPTMLGVVASVCTDFMRNIYQPQLIIGITPWHCQHTSSLTDALAKIFGRPAKRVQNGGGESDTSSTPNKASVAINPVRIRSKKTEVTHVMPTASIILQVMSSASNLSMFENLNSIFSPYKFVRGDIQNESWVFHVILTFISGLEKSLVK